MQQREVERRMVFSVLRMRGGGSDAHSVTNFSTDTYTWLPHDSRAVMPLERRLPKRVHELTSWWLLEKGTAHQRELKRKEVAEGSQEKSR